MSQNVVRKNSTLHLPAFPGKKAFGRFEQEFLDSRYRMLNEWIAGLIKSMVRFPPTHYLVCLSASLSTCLPTYLPACLSASL